MAEKLKWITEKDFLEESLWGPYHIKADIDYYDDLCDKYNTLYNNAQKAGADDESLKIIKRYSGKVKEALRKYYYGCISSSHNIIKNLLREIQFNPLAVSEIYSSKAFPGISGELQFFRARPSDRVTVFSSKDMLHIPFEKRGITGNYRFSIPGIPSLYLGNTSYACWIELGRLPEYMFNVSPVLLNGKQKVLNLAVTTRKQWGLHDCNKEDVQCWLKLLVLMIATSYVIDEPDRKFKSEYIVSQSIMLGCKELNLDGVVYFSKRVDTESLYYPAINVALFTKYKKGKSYSEICKCIKMGDSYNYSMYKQLAIVDRNQTYEDLRVLRMGVPAFIGSKKRPFSYSESEFCHFDKFLFATWKDKESIEFGNALPNDI